MAKKLIRRVYQNEDGTKYYTTHRADADYKLRTGTQTDRKGKTFTEEEHNPSFGGQMARGVAPSVFGAAVSGIGGNGAGVGAGVGAGINAAANVAANRLQAYNPNSKLAATGASAMSTSTSAGSKAYNREFLRTGSAGAAAKAGALAGAQGIAQGAISAVPGGKSIARGISPMIGGFMGGGLKGGLAGLARGIMTSPTLGSDVANLFKRSKASDYNEGTWGSNMTNIEDENKKDVAAAEDKVRQSAQNKARAAGEDDEEKIKAAGNTAVDAHRTKLQQKSQQQGQGQPQPQQEAAGAGGEEAKPAGGEEAKPAGGEEAKPAGGEEAKPAGEEEAKPAGEEEAKPAGGEEEEGGEPKEGQTQPEEGGEPQVPGQVAVGGVGAHGDGREANIRNQQVGASGVQQQPAVPPQQRGNEELEEVPQADNVAPAQPAQPAQPAPPVAAAQPGVGQALPSAAAPPSIPVAPKLQEAGGQQQPQQIAGQVAQAQMQQQQPQQQPQQMQQQPQQQQAQSNTLEDNVNDLIMHLNSLTPEALEKMSYEEIDDLSKQFDEKYQRALNMEDLSRQGQINEHRLKNGITNEEDAENSMPRNFYFDHPDNKGKYEDVLSQKEMDDIPLQNGPTADLINNDNARRNEDNIPFLKTPFGILRAYHPNDKMANNDEKYKNLLLRMQDDLRNGRKDEAQKAYDLLKRQDRGIRISKGERLKNHAKIIKDLSGKLNNKIRNTETSQKEIDNDYNILKKHYDEIPADMRQTRIEGEDKTLKDIYEDIEKTYTNNRRPGGFISNIVSNIGDWIAPMSEAPPRTEAPPSTSWFSKWS
jgi:hypothetical protein